MMTSPQVLSAPEDLSIPVTMCSGRPKSTFH